MILQHLPSLSSQATDSVIASTSGAGAAVAAVALSPPDSAEGIVAYLPALLAGVVGPVLAMAWRSVLVIYQARRARKKALLQAEAEAQLADQNPDNDVEAKAKLLEAQLLDAEIKAIDKLVDKVG